MRQALLGLLAFAGVWAAAGPALPQAPGAAESVPDARSAAVDFIRRVMSSTEDVWEALFQQRRLASYNPSIAHYNFTTVVGFTFATQSACGEMRSEAGPTYCEADKKVYIDPDFFTELDKTMHAPGDMAQAYVIAHEIAHSVQDKLGLLQASEAFVRAHPEQKNDQSVRVELQADCFAGVWGNSAKTKLKIDAQDLTEAVGATHAVGDDTLGYAHAYMFTHGAAEQRRRWFVKGFTTGDPAQCDTFHAAEL